MSLQDSLILAIRVRVSPASLDVPARSSGTGKLGPGLTGLFGCPYKILRDLESESRSYQPLWMFLLGSLESVFMLYLLNADLGGVGFPVIDDVTEFQEARAPQE